MSKVRFDKHPKCDGTAIAFLTLAMALAFGMSFGIAFGMPAMPHDVHEVLAAAPSLPSTAIRLAGCTP